MLAMQANDQRFEDAKSYLESLPMPEYQTVIADAEQYDLVIVVITMNRERSMTEEDRLITYHLGYLTQTTARLIQIFHSDNSATFQRKKLVVCNVDLQPQRFTEAQYLSHFAHTVSRYDNISARRMYDRTMNMFDREKDDYIFCLQTAHKFAAPYYLIVEDDVLLDDNALETVYFIMKYFDLFSATDWLFLKLYYPDKWLGYSQNWQTVVELGGYSVLGGSMFAGALTLISKRRKWLPDCRHLPVWFLFVVGAVFTALLCGGIGRQYVESWRKWSLSAYQLVAAPGCCTQAQLYPAHIVSDLCAHLDRVHSDHDFSVDIAIDGFAHVRGLKRLLIQPNIVKHIGLISNLRRYSKSAIHFL